MAEEAAVTEETQVAEETPVIQEIKNYRMGNKRLSVVTTLDGNPVEFIGYSALLVQFGNGMATQKPFEFIIEADSLEAAFTAFEEGEALGAKGIKDELEKQQLRASLAMPPGVVRT